MRKGIILNLKRFKLLNYVTLNKIFILLCVIFIAGIVIGTVTLSKNSVLSEYIKSIFNQYISLHKSNAFLESL